MLLSFMLIFPEIIDEAFMEFSLSFIFAICGLALTLLVLKQFSWMHALLFICFYVVLTMSFFQYYIYDQISKSKVEFSKLTPAEQAEVLKKMSQPKQ